MHLGLALVPQAGEPVPDGLVTVGTTLGQVNHPAAQDKVLYLELGYGDQAGCIWAGWARKEDAGGVAAGLKQGHCGGHGCQVSWDQTQQPSREGGSGPTQAVLTLEGNDVGRDIGQLQQDAGQSGVKHVQAVLGVSGFLQGEPAMGHETDRVYSHFCIWAEKPSILDVLAGPCRVHSLWDTPDTRPRAVSTGVPNHQSELCIPLPRIAQPDPDSPYPPLGTRPASSSTLHFFPEPPCPPRPASPVARALSHPTHSPWLLLICARPVTQLAQGGA